MPSLIQKHAHVKGQRSNHHIFKFQPNPSWAKKRPNRYTSLVTEVDIENSIPDSQDCIDSKYCYQPAGHIVTGDLKIITDSRIL